MSVISKKEPIILGLIDVLILAGSLVGALILRYWGVPAADYIHLHLVSFIIIFAYSVVVFYISGLYGRAVHIARSSIPGIVLKAQLANGVIAVILFYFVPGFTVTPKVTLFIYLALSSTLLVAWRAASIYPLLSFRRKVPALVIGSGPETDELIREMDSSMRSSLYCHKRLDASTLAKDGRAVLDGDKFIRYIVADLNDPQIDMLLPELYRHYFPHARIIDIHALYEELFDRIPLSCMNYAWIMSNVSSVGPKTYDLLKRLIDVMLGLVVGAAALVAYPFVAIALKIEDGGPVLIPQRRIGKHNIPFTIYKFRSMTSSDNGVWLPESQNRVTRVGRILRKTSIDELPQALAILQGKMSLIGPRADIIDLGKRLESEIPYYSVRTAVSPGLIGWAQINQEKPPQSVEETKLRLSYDLYYIKHRSLGLDLRIILRVFRTLLYRVGL